MLKQTVALTVGLMLASSGVALAAGKNAHAAKTDRNVVWPTDAIKWEPGPIEGTHVAKLWGDWMKGGPYGVLIKFDGGVMHALHHHSHDMKTIIISGTFVFQPEGGAETKLGAGSYLMQAGMQNHISGCAPGAECTFFMSSSDKFDLVMAKQPAAKGDAASEKADDSGVTTEKPEKMK